MTLDRPDHADARDVAEVVDRWERADLVARRGRDGLRDRMLGGRLDGAGEPEHVAARSAVERRDVGELHPALGDRARLVEDDGRDPARPLEDLRALDEDAELRAAPGADHERGRRREPERAGAGDDEHGDGRRERGGRRRR